MENKKNISNDGQTHEAELMDRIKKEWAASVAKTAQANKKPLCFVSKGNIIERYEDDDGPPYGRTPAAAYGTIIEHYQDDMDVPFVLRESA